MTSLARKQGFPKKLTHGRETINESFSVTIAQFRENVNLKKNRKNNLVNFLYMFGQFKPSFGK